MSKKGGKGSFLDDFFNNPFGGLFDFNGDGKEDLVEQWIGFKMFEEATKKEDTFFDDFDSDLEEYSWRQFCEDGFEYGVDPEDYETEEEYEEALEEAKYGWRDTVEVRYDLGLDPDNYETEEEYKEALEEAEYGWRDTVEARYDLGLDPDNYETEEEYEEALREAKYGWRDTIEARYDLGLDPDDYETEEEYEEALEEAEFDWCDDVEDDSEEDVDSEGDDPEEHHAETFESASLDNYKITIPISICFEITDSDDKGNEDAKEVVLPKEQQLEERPQKEAQQTRDEEEKQQKDKPLADKTIYTYCGVKLPFSDRPYSFRTDDSSIKIGDTVIVPVGKENKEMEGIVVAVGQYVRIAVPFPIEKTKFVLRKGDVKE